MKKPSLFIFVHLLILPLAANATRPECQVFADKLDNIHSQQRQGYSAKKGIKLAKQEKKAREKWWDCQNRRGKYKKTVKKKKSKQSTKATLANNPLLSHPTGPLTNTIRISSKYKGKKQQMWLNYYQQPDGCEKPKKLNKFAYCMENRQHQQRQFEQELLESNE